MTDNCSPARSVSKGNSIQGFAKSANLIELDQNAVSRVLINTTLDSLGVSNQKIVSNKLNIGTQALGQGTPTRPIILSKAILNRGYWVSLYPTSPVVDQSLARERTPLLLEHVFTSLIELSRSWI